jgi:hypothetical protein
MEAICCSLNRDCFISKIPRLPHGQTYRDFGIHNGQLFWAQVNLVPGQSG